MSTTSYNGTYTVPKQVAAFTFSVNSAADFTFASLTAMQTFVTQIANVNLADPVIQGFMGSDWTLIWGPVVWVNPSQTGTSLVADNTMACYYSPSQNLFVVAIAGTDPSSMFDWKNEDLAISSMVQWSSISQGASWGSGYISTASATGLNILLNDMTSSNVSLLTALQTYLQKNSITGATIAVCGHSLGGALAPCLGLYMHDNLSALGLSGQNISVYAYAGPTPGNEAFAKYFEGKIDGTTLSYSSQYNTLDIIPMGMAPADLASIPSVYDFSGGIPSETSPVVEAPANTFVGILSCALQAAGALALSYDLFGGSYTQVQTNLVGNTGTFNTDVDGNCAQSVANLITDTFYNITYNVQFSNLIRFLYQAPAQHGPAYCGGTITLPSPTLFNSKKTYTSQQINGFLGIDAFTIEFQLNMTNNPPANAVFEGSVARSLKKITGIDLAKLPQRAPVAAN